MGKASAAIVGALALGGSACVLGAAHSLVVPIKLSGNAKTTEPANPSGGASDPVAPETSPDSVQGEETQASVPIGVAASGRDVPPPGPDAGGGHAESAFELIDMARAKSIWDEGFAPFIDARPLHQYEAGHIAYALWMPAGEITGAKINELFRLTGDGAGEVVIYCVGGDCDASENVAIRLQEVGFTNLLIMRDGYDDWVAAGYEAHEGPPEPLGDG